jgi:hypothetical protein
LLSKHFADISPYQIRSARLTILFYLQTPLQLPHSTAHFFPFAQALNKHGGRRHDISGLPSGQSFAFGAAKGLPALLVEVPAGAGAGSTLAT